MRMTASCCCLSPFKERYKHHAVAPRLSVASSPTVCQSPGCCRSHGLRFITHVEALGQCLPSRMGFEASAPHESPFRVVRGNLTSSVNPQSSGRTCSLIMAHQFKIKQQMDSRKYMCRLGPYNGCETPPKPAPSLEASVYSMY